MMWVYFIDLNLITKMNSSRKNLPLMKDEEASWKKVISDSYRIYYFYDLKNRSTSNFELKEILNKYKYIHEK